MFALLQVQAAMLVGAGRAGGSLGNMICPNHVVAVEITVELSSNDELSASKDI